MKLASVRKDYNFVKIIGYTRYLMLIGLRILGAGMFIVTPLILSGIINNEEQVTLRHVLVIISVLLLGHFISLFIVFVVNRIIARFNRDAFDVLYNRIFKMSYDAYISKEPMAILENVRNVIGSYAMYYLNAIPTVFINIVTITVVVIIIFTMSPFVALLMLGTLPLTYFGYKLLNKNFKCYLLSFGKRTQNTPRTKTQL